MICLTSDIHHMSLGTGNQYHTDVPEAVIATRFAASLLAQDVKGTFFVSGKCFREEWEDIRHLCQQPNIEIGGHNYSCLTPEILHRVWHKVTKNYNGPLWFQSRDIALTKRIIEDKCGRTIKSWRNHMYMHGPNTEFALANNNIYICCDRVKRYGPLWERHSTGVINFPINIIPDHEHLYHAERTPAWVENWVKRYNWSDDYGSQSYEFSEWFRIFQREVMLRERNGVVSHILIHPITIYLCEGDKALQNVVDFLSDFESITVTDLLGPVALDRQRSVSSTKDMTTSQCIDVGVNHHEYT